MKLKNIFLITILLLSGCNNNSTADPYKSGVINIGALNGPTLVGLGKLYNDLDTNNQLLEKDVTYNIESTGTADIIIQGLVAKKYDVAMLSANLASTIFNDKSVDIKALAINTLSPFSLVSRDSVAIDSLDDLQGLTIHIPNQGSTPDIITRYLLSKENIKDVNFTYHSEGSVIVAGLKSGVMDVAMLPEPAATSIIVQTQNDESKIVHRLFANDLFHEVVGEDKDIVTSVIVVRTDYIKNNKETLETFLKEYEESVSFMSDPSNLEEAASIVSEKLKLVPNINIAKLSLPKCSMVFIKGSEMKELLLSFYNILLETASASIGSKIVSDDFFY